MPDIELPKPNERDWGESELFNYVKFVTLHSLIEKGLLSIDNVF
jgi:hypothetical protein